MTTKEMLNKIEAKRVALNNKNDECAKERKSTIEYYERKFKELAPRVKDLLSICNALIENDLPIGTRRSAFNAFGYKDEFVAESIDHDLGFFIEGKTLTNEGELIGVGIFGGGLYGHDIAIDAEGNLVKNPLTAHRSFNEPGTPYSDFQFKAEKFMKNFNEFERKVHEYVSNL